MKFYKVVVFDEHEEDTLVRALEGHEHAVEEETWRRPGSPGEPRFPVRSHLSRGPRAGGV